ncbi:hypothetical protein bAD24_p00720 (plasmid) [Burkholderia sp. AD24]|nr:hypothetical protein bAD24_p00720 [Burkholderia sp. AD24]
MNLQRPFVVVNFTNRVVEFFQRLLYTRPGESTTDVPNNRMKSVESRMPRLTLVGGHFKFRKARVYSCYRLLQFSDHFRQIKQSADTWSVGAARDASNITNCAATNRAAANAR